MLIFLLGCLCGFVATILLIAIYITSWGGDKDE